ncbi:hypothetical protein A3A20_00700 [Candidatus Wolfebacteria bacterium RIFCSPLOWO2_01_FULL_45_19]|uniref:Uncharacterized protein n=1 Tax=Candidatus Wolfebacteria bacterium RIFCSPLOWO2_01_FULL_45_19 TaxID=1802557 RepID=A0A1F8DPR3_9BACT|nr:MAG: hypothetical protein UX23_C0009G0004 [Parcubacteria group bacterium GW2011_GWB1_45_9]OGM90623.1 MAG: hypothetical protein A3A20_00700 [Candidatus Wolfebacteria bacterium RIFCSPLOWO2_01_FULL_45_19]
MEPKFEHKGLEADIERLKADVAERLKSPEAMRGGISHRDIVREATRPLVYPSGPSSQSRSVLPDYAEDFSAETKLKIEELIDMAIHKGIEKAATAARKSGSAAIMDAFHDAVTTKLLEEFQRLGILKK